MYVRYGRPTFARPYVGVHRRASPMSSSLLLQQCPTCLVRLAWIFFVMGGRWPYSWCLVGCCHQDMFNIARNVLVELPSRFFSSCFVSVQVVHPYSGIDTTAVWKKRRFILSVRSDFHMIDSLSIAVPAFVSRVSMSFSVDKIYIYIYIYMAVAWKVKKVVEHDGNSDTSWSCYAWNSLQWGLEKIEIWARIEAIQTTALLRSVGLFKRVLEAWVDFLCHSDSSERLPVKSDVKKNSRSEIIIIIIQTDHLISPRRPDLPIVNKKRESAEEWTLITE